MALIASELIEAARDWHPSFTRQRHPDPTLLRHLSREQRRLIAKATQLSPLTFAEWTEPVTLAAYSWTNGVALPAHFRVHDGEATLTNGEIRPLDQTSAEIQQVSLFTFSVVGGYAHLPGDADDWRYVESVRFQTTPIPAALYGPKNELVLPDSAEGVLTASLARMMAGRGSQSDGITASAFRQELESAERDWLEEITTAVNTNWMVRVV